MMRLVAGGLNYDREKLEEQLTSVVRATVSSELSVPILQNPYRISKRKASAWSDTKALPTSVIPMTEFPASDTENSF